MAYQQIQPQLRARQQGFAQQPPAQGPAQGHAQQPTYGQVDQQPLFQQQPPIQQPMGAVQGGYPTAEQAWPTAGRTGPVPRQSTDAVPAMQGSFGPQGSGQSPQATQQAVTPTGQQYGQLQPAGQFGQWTSSQVGQEATQGIGSLEAVRSTTPESYQQAMSPTTGPQAQAVPQLQTSGAPAVIGGQTPLHGQWSTQGAGLAAPSSGGSPTGQSLQVGPQSLPAPVQEFGGGSFQAASEQAGQELVGTPSVDVVDTPDEVVLFVDLPGFDEENIQIQADGQNLTVTAERHGDEDEREGRTFAVERPRKVQRTIRLPTRANVNEANATYENGVCTITLPKMEEDRQHEIAFQ